MSQFKTSLTEVVPFGPFVVTFVANILVIRQLIIVFALLYGILFYLSSSNINEIVTVLADSLIFFIEFIFLGLLLWIIQKSLDVQNRKKSLWFLFNSSEDA